MTFTTEEMTEAFGSRLEFGKPLAPLTTFRTGGPARFFYEAVTIEQLAAVVATARKLGLEFVIFGGGSNLLVSDEGYEGLVVKVGVRKMELDDSDGIICGAGEDLSDLVSFAVRNSLTGLEFATDIWGTVGGAIYGNAGAYGGQIGGLVEEVTVLDKAGTVQTLDRDACCFQYRDSRFKTSGEIIVEARLKLQEGDPAVIQARVDEISTARQAKFPADGHCAGCFFKNIPDPNEEYGKLAAGKLLEQVGAKDMSVGGARVYEKHANIILSSENATSADIKRLSEQLKEEVMQKFGIILEEEIILVGRFYS
jgi:UDP-N-acetylmuramate dehydrogenase